MTVADDLRAARKLIKRPECWTRGEFARHKNGNPIGPDETNASCWCAQGALRRVCGAMTERYWAGYYALDANLPAPPQVVWFFNDTPTTTHADILALFDRAIAAAEERAE